MLSFFFSVLRKTSPTFDKEMVLIWVICSVFSLGIKELSACFQYDGIFPSLHTIFVVSKGVSEVLNTFYILCMESHLVQVPTLLWLSWLSLLPLFSWWLFGFHGYLRLGNSLYSIVSAVVSDKVRFTSCVVTTGSSMVDLSYPRQKNSEALFVCLCCSRISQLIKCLFLNF